MRFVKRIFCNLNGIFTVISSTVISSDEDNQWLVWDTRTGRSTLTLSVIQNAQNQDTTSNDYRYIALSNRGNTVQIWDTTTGREVLDYRGHAANVRVLATGWEPDNRHIASLGSDGRLLIWDAFGKCPQT